MAVSGCARPMVWVHVQTLYSEYCSHLNPTFTLQHTIASCWYNICTENGLMVITIREIVFLDKKKWLFCESASRILGLDALTIKFAESLQLYREIGVLQMLKPIVPARAQDLADQHLIWYCPASCWNKLRHLWTWCNHLNLNVSYQSICGQARYKLIKFAC